MREKIPWPADRLDHEVQAFQMAFPQFERKFAAVAYIADHGELVRDKRDDFLDALSAGRCQLHIDLQEAKV